MALCYANVKTIFAQSQPFRLWHWPCRLLIIRHLTTRRFTFFFALFCVLVAVGLLLPVELPYSVTTRGVVRPAFEWELGRTTEGSLTQVFNDNLTGTVRSYGITEFQRGDVVRFEVNPELTSRRFVMEGDTIGVLLSNEEQRRIIQLEGDLKILMAEMEFHTTGQKPEDVERAEREVTLAQQELETQQKLTARSKMLLTDSVIPLQEYEIAYNELKVRELALGIAEARLLSVTTGEKPEQAELVSARVQACRMQLDQLRARIRQFTLLAPVSGMVVMDRYMDGSGKLIKVADTSALVAVAPIRMADLGYVSVGDSVETMPVNGNEMVRGRVVEIDNVSRLIDLQSAVFITILFDSNEELIPESSEVIKVTGASLTPCQYARKLFNSPQ